MENLNAEQVKKALECCTLGDCTPCPYHQIYVGCRDRMAEDALALSNSQEQRIGELAEENERLKAKNKRYAELEEGCLVTGYNNIKADTVRNMQERLKQYIDVGHYRSPTEICFSELDVANIIDRIAKEMLEDEE